MQLYCYCEMKSAWRTVSSRTKSVDCTSHGIRITFSQKQLCKNTIQSIWQTVRTRAQGKFTGVRGAGAAMGNKCLVDVL